MGGGGAGGEEEEKEEVGKNGAVHKGGVLNGGAKIGVIFEHGMDLVWTWYRESIEKVRFKLYPNPFCWWRYFERNIVGEIGEVRLI